MKKRRGWLLAAAGLAAVMAAALTLAYQGRMLLPLWIRWESAHICGETAAEPDEILLRGRRATVCKGGAAVWQSERGIRVQDVLWCDIDHDGEKELLLLCWKRGRYGESRPFWVEEDEKAGRSIFISTTGQGMAFARSGWRRISAWMPGAGALTSGSVWSLRSAMGAKARGTG